MQLKLIVALVSDEKTDTVVDAARAGGATGATIFTGVRGEGLKAAEDLLRSRPSRPGATSSCSWWSRRGRATFWSASAMPGSFEQEPGAGIAFQVPIEDAVGLTTQLPTILDEVED